MLGNSLTIHPPNPSVEGYANWGMAASKPENDFTHLLAKRMNAELEAVNLSAWERNHDSFDLSNLNPYFGSMPDLIIVRFGENVGGELQNFEQSFSKMIEYIKSKNSKAEILITGCFWKNEALDKIMLRVAEEKKIPFVALSQLDQPGNRSFIGAQIYHLDGSSYKIVDQGVADHSGDLGMEAIANTIFEAIRASFKK